MNIDEILLLLSPNYINKGVLLEHDWAREKFSLPTLTVQDHREFKYLITTYVQHHRKLSGDGQVGDQAAFGEGRRAIEGAKPFNQDQYQEPYAAALMMARDGTSGGMRVVLDEIANAFKKRALQEHTDYVFYEFIDINSKADNLALSKAYFARFGDILRRFGAKIEEDTFAWNTRAALDYHRMMIESILGIARKI